MWNFQHFFFTALLHSLTTNFAVFFLDGFPTWWNCNGLFWQVRFSDSENEDTKVEPNEGCEAADEDDDGEKVPVTTSSLDADFSAEKETWRPGRQVTSSSDTTLTEILVEDAPGVGFRVRGGGRVPRARHGPARGQREVEQQTQVQEDTRPQQKLQHIIIYHYVTSLKGTVSQPIV